MSALKAKTPVLAGLVIDVCMGGDLAKELVHLRSDLHVIVSWQTMSWDSRPFDDFRFAELRHDVPLSCQADGSAQCWPAVIRGRRGPFEQVRMGQPHRRFVYYFQPSAPEQGTTPGEVN